MKKSLFFAGALLASCFALTSCSGGGEGNDEVNVGAMSGRTFVFNSPNNALGAMYVQVGDRIGSSDSCDARFYFGTRAGSSSPGEVKLLSTVKSEEGKKSWEKCEFTFQVYDAEISEEVNFKAFFAIWLASASTAENDEDAGNNGGGGDTTQDAGGMAADSYVTGLEPVKVSMNYASNNSGEYRMEPTTIYLDDEEEVVQTVVVKGDFTIR
ncbi:MAG: hypothetical protein IJE66_04920 [Akkermansia sp.]|nr:hypothetical protein [Akkermansia sp.]